MHFKKRFIIYLVLATGLFFLFTGGIFRPEKKGFSAYERNFAEGEKAEEEAVEEPFSGKGGPKEPTLELMLLPYEVQPGDNLWDIARRADLDLDTLISANKLKRANLLNAGEIIHVPNQRGVFHQVKKGQSLSELAAAYKVAVEEILEINGIEDPGALSVNENVFIPGAKLLPEEREYLLGWGFIKPCRGWISSGYGWRRDPFSRQRRFHHGIDLAVPKGTPVYAARDGIVTYAGWMGAYGQLIIIKHSQGYSTRYAHNSATLVKKGQKIKQGQLIARVGNTGRSTGSHLHFEIRRWGKPINPKTQIRNYANRK